MKASIEQLAFAIKKNENVKFDEDIRDEIKFALKRFSTNAKEYVLRTEIALFIRLISQMIIQSRSANLIKVKAQQFLSRQIIIQN